MTPSTRGDRLLDDDDSVLCFMNQTMQEGIDDFTEDPPSDQYPASDQCPAVSIFMNQDFLLDIAEAAAPAAVEAPVSVVAPTVTQTPASGGPPASVDPSALAQTPALAEPLHGSQILTSFPNDMHFICGCANFDPFGHNAILRDEAINFFQNELKKGKECKPRKSVLRVVELASQRARERSGEPTSKFRIWSATNTRVRLKHTNWSELLFEELTGNEGKMKDRMEWPLRRAIDKAQVVNWNPDATVGSDDIGTTSSLTALTAELSCSVPSDLQLRIAETMFSRANPDTQRAQRPRVELTPAELVLEELVARYSSLEIEGALGRLDKDRGFQPVDDWARKLYERFRDNPGDENCFNLNKDRKTCLNLVYDLVNEWQKHGFSDDFAQAITKIFKVQRLERILGLCLPLDRAQALYKMRCCHDEVYGIPWYSELHLTEDCGFESKEEKGEWIEYLKSHPNSSAPMNKRLFRLINSPHFGFREKDDFKRWGKPARVPGREQAP